MRPPPPGFTLLEVLLAVLVITVGLLGVAGTLGPAAALAGEGRDRGRVAVVFGSRIDQLRAALLAGGPGCLAPPGGTLRHADGVVEEWSASARDGAIEVEVAAGVPSSRRGIADTVRTTIPCP
jgi:prepilin-type N-terminal cleavage/methylation domain-containing protein